MRFLTAIWYGFTQLMGLILPFFGRAADFRRWGPAVRWTVRLILLAVILLLLYYLNHLLGPVKWLGRAPPWLQPYWLPSLFLLFCALSWLAWWLWKLLLPEAESNEFPDIDQAWDEARAALNQQGIDLTDVPLFFLLGRPLAAEEAMMQASQVPLAVRKAPARDDAPLHVYANRDGIYVTCAGCSLLGKQAAILAGETDSGLSTGSDASPGGASPDFDPTATMSPAQLMHTMSGKDSPEKEVARIILRARDEGREITASERQRMRILQRKPRPSLLKNQFEVDRLAARLTHLCRLIVRDRRPYCPLNAIMVLIPFAATDSEEDATETGYICQRDLAVARRVFQVHCPTLAMVCDLEIVPGFREFMERIPPQQRLQRVGQRFPLAPLVEPGQVPGLLEKVSRVICRAVFPAWVYKFFRVEAAGRETTDEVTQINSQLYKLLFEMREREARINQILNRGILAEANGLLLFGGCYLAATGTDTNDQAFVAGVFRRLYHPDEKTQNYVSWTADKIAEEAEYQRWTRFGYILTGVFSMLILVLIFIWRQGY
jgi:hypothetical protein